MVVSRKPCLAIKRNLETVSLICTCRTPYQRLLSRLTAKAFERLGVLLLPVATLSKHHARQQHRKYHTQPMLSASGIVPRRVSPIDVGNILIDNTTTIFRDEESIICVFTRSSYNCYGRLAINTVHL